MQWACDEDTHRVDFNYKETRIKKRCFSLLLSRCPQSSQSLASNYVVCLVSALTLNQRRKRRDVFAPNEKEKSSSTATRANRTP